MKRTPDPAGDDRPLPPEQVSEHIAACAASLGFHRVGIVPVEPPRRYDAYTSWLAAGRHGDMAYMARADHVAARRDLGALARGAKTVVAVALAYPARGGDFVPAGDLAIRGTIARYARGADYHQVLKRKLYALAENLASALGRAVAARACVDSAPLLERDLAERAGIGFTAKNTMTIIPGLGSYVFLGELLLDVDAAPRARPPEPPRCGRCRACLDACPTGAFAGAFVLDARRCISYLTIEHKGAIPRDLRPALGQMIFGCDICQEVCPFNAAAPDRNSPAPELAARGPDRGAPDLIAVLAMGANQHRRFTAGTALRRASRAMLLRNVCVALGNAGDAGAIPALAAALADRSPLVRGHAAWALGRLGDAGACERALATETDAWVRSELADAIFSARACARSG